jgi:hypothetical protein
MRGYPEEGSILDNVIVVCFLANRLLRQIYNRRIIFYPLAQTRLKIAGG